MCRYLARLTLAGLLLLSGCAEHLPALSVDGLSSSDGSGPPRVTDITDQVACELSLIKYSVYRTSHRDILKPNVLLEPPGFNEPAQNSYWMQTLAHSDNPEYMANLVTYLTAYHFVASVNLTLDVTDTEGANPSLSFITPFNKMKAPGNSFAMGLGGQWSGTQDRKMTLAYPIDMASLPPPTGRCFQSNWVFLKQAAGLDSGLKGNLGLADILADGLVTLDTTKAYSYYGSGSAGAAATTVYHSIDIHNDSTYVPPKGEKPVGLSEFNGYITFGPPSQVGSDIRSATLNGIWSFGKGNDCSGTLTGTTLPNPSAKSGDNVSVVFYAAGTMTWLPTADSNMAEPVDSSLVNLCSGTNKAVVKGLIDANYMSDRTARSLTLGLYTNGIGAGNHGVAFSDTSNPDVVTDVLVYAPPSNLAGGLVAYSIVPPSADELGLIKNYEASLSAPVAPTNFKTLSSEISTLSVQANASPASAGAVPGASTSAAATAASSSGASASTGTSFGSTVDFTVVYGLNGGPTWSLTHFKGPAGSASMFSIGRQVVDTLNIAFVPACQDAENVKPVVKNYWDSIAACNASSFANATAAAQGYNTTQQIATSP